MRLQEAATLGSDAVLGISDVLYGVSPDYAVIAQKSAPEDIWARTGGAFERDFGIDLHTLAGRYDGQILARREEAEVHAAETT